MTSCGGENQKDEYKLGGSWWQNITKTFPFIIFFQKEESIIKKKVLLHCISLYTCDIPYGFICKYKRTLYDLKQRYDYNNNKKTLGTIYQQITSLNNIDSHRSSLRLVWEGEKKIKKKANRTEIYLRKWKDSKH